MKPVLRMVLILTLLLVLPKSITASEQSSDKLRVAVASNFLITARQLAQMFQQQTGVQVLLSSASSGKITTQIEAGAPYDVFLSADIARPQRLVNAGFAATESLAIYAIGQLVLVSHEALTQPLAVSGRRLAIANPKIAPYGYAAQRWLTEQQLSPKLIMGENINQAWHFFQIGAVPFAIVALSQVQQAPETIKYQLPLAVDRTLLKQGMVTLKRSKQPDLAQQFHEFILSSVAQTMINQSGYLIE